MKKKSTRARRPDAQAPSARREPRAAAKPADPRAPALHAKPHSADARSGGHAGTRASKRGREKVDDLEPQRDCPADTVLTTDQGLPIPHTDDSLKAGARGPTLLEDFHLREKITRFDHERIPERVVHARGSGAHGFFRVYESLEDLTCARFLTDTALRTPVFVRFSTVVGSRGSTDTARDVRGFATKFYTPEGNFDLVGNNIPVFFIQDGAKFPDLVHAVKPEPHHEMPQAASAHDTFWDFVSLVPETIHMVMWVMSDRAIPRSYRMMEGFGVHTFRLVNAEGRSVLCKFHWKPVLGAHSLVWDEAQKISGKDTDFHRRDLWEAIETGNYPEYELGLQIVDEADELAFGFDLLDATKLLPEEVVPVRRVGRLTLDRNPDNFFAETEQVAFCVGNLVRGIDVTNDPLMQARLFSYLDTQITRLGGPNHAEIPINRPIAPAHNHQQDGFKRHTIPTARAMYSPNSIAGGMPAPARLERGAFSHFPQGVEGPKTRERSETFLDHFSQATLFLNSQSENERRHMVRACRFELGKVERLGIRERVVALFREVDEEFARDVAAGIGVSLVGPARKPAPKKAARGKTVTASPALSLENQPRKSIKTRKVALLAADGVRAADVDATRTALHGGGAAVEVISFVLGPLRSEEGRPIDVDKTFLTASSVLYDAVYVPGGETSVAALLESDDASDFVHEAYRHAKPVASSGEGYELLADAGVAEVAQGPQAGGAKSKLVARRGVVAAPAGADGAFTEAFVAALAAHRHFERELETGTI